MNQEVAKLILFSDLISVHFYCEENPSRNLFVALFIYLSTFLSVYLSVHLSVGHFLFSSIYLSISLSVYIYLSVWLMMFFWVLAPCRLGYRFQRFRETYCLHLQPWHLPTSPQGAKTQNTMILTAVKISNLSTHVSLYLHIPLDRVTYY
jgi:hypothetical protein